MDYNLTWKRLDRLWGDGHPTSADTHSTTKDPMLGSAPPFTLVAGSGAIGAGTNLFSDVPIDFLGVARPTTAPFDIGAYQSSSGP